MTEGGRGTESLEGERKAGEAVDAGEWREVSVNYCLQFGMSECGPGQ